MTVAQLKELLYDLPDNMEVVQSAGDILVSCCYENSGVSLLKIDGTTTEAEMFVLLPCTCQESELEVDPTMN